MRLKLNFFVQLKSSWNTVKAKSNWRNLQDTVDVEFRSLRFWREEASDFFGVRDVTKIYSSK